MSSINRPSKNNNTKDSGEVLGIILVIISSFLLFCLITSSLILGDIGLAIHNVFLGLFGFSAYPILLAILIFGVVKLQNRQLNVKRKHIAAIIIIAVCIILIAHLATSTKYINSEEGFSYYVTQVYKNRNTIGGLAFGLITYALAISIQPVTTYILLSLIIVVTLFFVSNVYSRSVKTKNKTKIKPKNSSKHVHYTQDFNKTTKNGLYVGTIIPNNKQTSEFGSFDSLSQTMQKTEELSAYDKLAKKEEEYKKENARHILFANNEDAYEKLKHSIPYSNEEDKVEEPIEKNTPSQEEQSQQIDDKQNQLFNVSFPAEKTYENNFIPGEIINGDEQSNLLKNTIEKVQAEPIINDNINSEISQNYVENSSNKDNDELDSQSDFDYNSLPPIINGDYYDKEAIRQQELERQKQSIQQQIDFSCFESQPVINEEHIQQEVNDHPSENLDINNSITETEDNLSQLNNQEIDIIDEDNEPDDIQEDNSNDDIYFNIQEENDIIENSIDSENEDIYDEIIDDTNIPNEENNNEKSYFESKETEEIDINEIAQPDFEDIENLSPVQEQTHTIEIKDDFDTRVNEIDSHISSHLYDSIREEKQIKPQPIVEKQEEVKKEKIIRKQINYHTPDIDLLQDTSTPLDEVDDDCQEKITLLEQTLNEFKLPAKVIGVTRGPAVTRYELDMPAGITVKKIEQYSQDIKYNLAAKGEIRIETPIPGKRAVGVEVPNNSIAIVGLKDIINSPEFKNSTSPLTLALGKNIEGKIIICKLEKMPHLLIAGATNSGKSACLNSIIISLLYKSSPDDVKIILIDPKRVEFTAYSGLPHMLIKNAITEVPQALKAVTWAQEEMENRYKLFQEHRVRNIQEFNSSGAVKEQKEQKMPYIVMIVDELADLMMTSNNYRKDLEDGIMRIAQKARAAGIHLILATQRPSSDVLTGTIKSNFPSRIAFAVSSSLNSRIILDQTGAEFLLGRGDMLYAPVGQSEPTRVQGAYVTNEEVQAIVEKVKNDNPYEYDDSFEKSIEVKEPEESDDVDNETSSTSEYDELLIDVVRRVMELGQASASMIQRRFKVGYARASRIIDQLETLHFIGPMDGSKPREVYITKEKFKEFFGEDYE